MAEYIGDQIADLIVTRLQYLTVARAGYDTVLASVTRPTGHSEQPQNHLDTEVLMFWPPEEDEELSTPSNPPILGWVQEYQVSVVINPSESDTSTPVDRHYARVARDCLRAMMQDPASPGVYEPRFGGRANWTRITPPDAFDGGQSGVSGLNLGLRVGFQLLETNLSLQPGA